MLLVSLGLNERFQSVDSYPMSKCGTGCSVHFIVTGNLRAAWIHSVSISLVLINNNKRIDVFPFARTLQTYGFSRIHEGLICDSLITFGGESMKEFTKGEEKMNKIAGQELALVPWIQMSRGVFWTIFVSDLRKMWAEHYCAPARGNFMSGQ